MEIKEGTLISYISVLGYIALGVVDKVVDDYKVWAYWSDERDNETSWIDKRDILEAWEVINFEEEAKMTKKTDELKIGFDWEPKKKEIKKGMLITFKSNVVTGLEYPGLVKMVDDYIYVYYPNSKRSIAVSEKRITGVYDVVIHEPKEELSVQQESANFAHAAVQGIINAHAEKNGEEAPAKLVRDDFSKGYDKGFKDAMELRIIGSFTFKDFDLSVARTWKKQDFKDAVSNAALGLTGEAGEVADLIKKAIYHGRNFKKFTNLEGIKHTPLGGEERPISPEDVKDELSDVLFYVSAMAQEFGFTLEDVAKHNREKLEKRFPEGFSTEASAQKKDRASEVKPEGEILLGYDEHWKEDTLEYVRVGEAPFSKTYFSTDYELKKTLKELRDGQRVTIEDKHKGEFKFTRVGDLIRVHFKDLEGNLDSHTCLVKVSYEEVTD